MKKYYHIGRSFLKMVTPHPICSTTTKKIQIWSKYQGGECSTKSTGHYSLSNHFKYHLFSSNKTCGINYTEEEQRQLN